MFHSIFFRNLSENVQAKELLKSIRICYSYGKNKRDTFYGPWLFFLANSWQGDAHRTNQHGGQLYINRHLGALVPSKWVKFSSSYNGTLQLLCVFPCLLDSSASCPHHDVKCR